MIKLTSHLLPALFLAAAGGLEAQSVTVDQTSLNLMTQSGGSAVSKTVNVGSATGAATFFYLISSSQCSPWLQATPSSGMTPAAVTISADPTGLQPGSYSGCIVTVYGGTGAPVAIQVGLTVAALGANPASLSFSYTLGGSIPAVQNVSLTGPSVNFNVSASSTGNWLQVGPASGTTPATLNVLLNASVVPGLAAQTYSGTVTVTPTTGPALQIPVSLTVSPTPPVTLSATSLALAYQTGGANNSPSQTLTLSTTGAQQLNYGLTNATVAPNPAGRIWFLLNPSSGIIPANGSAAVSVGYDTTAGLPAGTYTGSFVVSTPGGSPAQQTVNVSLLVSASPLLLVPTGTLNFLYETGGAIPAAQTFTPCTTNVACNSASGQSNVTVTAAANGGTWLNVSPASGTTGSLYSVSVSPGNLAVGQYTGSISVSSPGSGNSPQTIPVRLTVANDPLLETSAASLSFPFQIGQSAPPSQTVAVTTSTGAALNYAASASATTCGNGWLSVSNAATGPTPGSFTVSVNATGLSAGICTGAITVTGTVPATGAAAINSVSIPVTLTVSANPLLTVALPGNPPAPPAFTAQQSGSAPAPQSIVVGSTNPGATLNYSMSFAATCGGNWLLAGPLAGSTASGANTITLSVLPGLLSAGGGCGPGGVYTATVTLTATNPTGPAVDNATAANPIVIPVTFQVTAGTLTLSTKTLTFSQPPDGAAPAAQTVNVTSTGAALTYSVAVNGNSTVSWLSAAPLSGTTPGSVSVSVDGSRLAPGAYTGYVTLTAPNAGGSPAVITVNFTVTSGTISAPNATLSFAQVQGGASPGAKAVAVTGTAGLNFTASTTTTDKGSWLTATPATGAIPSSVQISVNGASLQPGQYTGSVTIASPGATGSPIVIPVNLTVTAPVSLSVSSSSLTFSSYVLGSAAPPAQSVQLTASAAAPFTTSVKTTDGANWLTVTPATGNAGPAATTLAIGINPAGITGSGTYTGTITISTAAGLTPATIGVTLGVVAISAPIVAGLQNDASYAVGAIAPGENVVIYGTGIGPSQMIGLQLTSSGTVSTLVGGTQVLFDNNPAPIIYTSSGQTSVIVPHEVAGRTQTQLTVVYQGVSSAPLPYSVVVAAPGVYTQNANGSGPGSILNQDFSLNGANNPAARQSYVMVYLTGTGDTTPALVTGAVTPGNGSGLKTSLITYTATVAGLPATVSYQGTAPGYAEGVMQFNIQIPANAPSGAQPIVISSGTLSTQQGVTVQVK